MKQGHMASVNDVFTIPHAIAYFKAQRDIVKSGDGMAYVSKLSASICFCSNLMLLLLHVGVLLSVLLLKGVVQFCFPFPVSHSRGGRIRTK